MYKQSFFALLLSFTFLVGSVKPAQAMNGAADAVALVSTGVVAVTGALSAYTWHQASNSDFILNQLAYIQGENSWSAWFMRHCGKVAVATGVVATVLMLKNCEFNRIGIPYLDRKLGLPRGKPQ